ELQRAVKAIAGPNFASKNNLLYFITDEDGNGYLQPKGGTETDYVKIKNEQNLECLKVPDPDYTTSANRQTQLEHYSRDYKTAESIYNYMKDPKHECGACTKDCSDANPKAPKATKSRVIR